MPRPVPARAVSTFLTCVLPLAVLGITVGLARQPGPPAMPFASGECAQPPQWKPVYLSDPTAAQAAGTGWNLWAASAIGTQVCSPGQLELALDSQPVAGPPNLTVLLDGMQLQDIPVSTARTVTVNVPRRGALSLAYLNDYYRADVRAVEVQQVRSDVLGCRRLIPDQPPTNPRNTYVPQSDLLVLLDPDPISYTMCGAGTVQVRMRGMVGGGALPVVTVTQSGRQLAAWRPPVEPATFSLKVGAGSFTLNMSNPYARETADRNLFVKALRWTPAPSR